MYQTLVAIKRSSKTFDVARAHRQCHDADCVYAQPVIRKHNTNLPCFSSKGCLPYFTEFQSTQQSMHKSDCIN